MWAYKNSVKKSQFQHDEISIALAGNPNVGKSTLFNALTGLRQHTGNWPGKTVASAAGHFSYKGKSFRITDLPGTYSLSARSPEEEITRDQICFGRWDLIILVVDATSMERNLPLVLETLEITDRVLLCVNLMDEAERRGIRIDLGQISRRLGIPAVGVTASQKKTLTPLLDVLVSGSREKSDASLKLFPEEIIRPLSSLQEYLGRNYPYGIRRAAWLSVLMAVGDPELVEKASHWCGEDLSLDEEVRQRLTEGLDAISGTGISRESIETAMVFHRLKISSALVRECVRLEFKGNAQRENRIDAVLNNVFFGYFLMILVMAGIFFLTICGTDYLTILLETVLFKAKEIISSLLLSLGCPLVLYEISVDGAYRMLAWVVSVMLPPMLIFFPLFTFMEELGYLPRVAFALDRPFQRCGSCGKQALTMAMGLGCNAVGVTGCRIIDGSRERTLAILTNSFVPCSGRFPMLILITGLFLTSRSICTALLLSACMILAVGLTMGMTNLLSRTLLKGNGSVFVMELPPFRRPKLNQILVRSMLDRVGTILGRAAAVAAPAGVLLWLLMNIQIQDNSLLQSISGVLDPLGHALGMDGTILTAFVLGSSANETVIPIALMIYSANNSMSSSLPMSEIRAILQLNGWTWKTAAGVLTFALFHWPCITTLLTVRKETGSMRWTVLSALLPTICGVTLCFCLHLLLGIIG